MISTVELTDSKINRKIAGAHEAIRILCDPAIVTLIESTRVMQGTNLVPPLRKSTGLASDLDALTSELEKIQEEYMLNTSHLLVQYAPGSGDQNVTDITKQYYGTIARECFVARINDVISRLQALGKQLILSAPDSAEAKIVARIASICDRALNVVIDNHTVQKPLGVCSECGKRMELHSETSEYHCECGKIKKVEGMSFYDNQNRGAYGTTRATGHDPLRHYRKWMQLIFGKDKKEFTEEELRKINEAIRKNKYPKSRLTCDIMRKILKDPGVRCTHLNNFTTSLIIKLGGKAPPLPSYEEDEYALIKFVHIMHWYGVAYPGPGYKPYYPYFIYKILESMYPKGHPKRIVLSYIHLQSRDTVIKNDCKYQEICRLGAKDGLVYKSTDMTEIL